jgi:hypothetical protein
VLLTMLDTFRRMFADSRPVDFVMLVIEFLVLAIIAIEFGSAFRNKRRTKRRLEAIRDAMSEGQALQMAAPRGIGATEGSQNWAAAVNAWIAQTHKLLQSYSVQAAASFLHDAGGVGTTYPSLVDSYNYAVLVARLNNLRGVMEKPDVYF